MTCDYCKLPIERNQTDAHCKGCGAPLSTLPPTQPHMGELVNACFCVPENSFMRALPVEIAGIDTKLLLAGGALATLYLMDKK